MSAGSSKRWGDSAPLVRDSDGILLDQFRIEVRCPGAGVSTMRPGGGKGHVRDRKESESNSGGEAGHN